LFAVAFFLAVVNVIYDLYRVFLSNNSERFNEIYGEETNYFSRLSNIERKRWLVEETYNRNELGLQLTDDSTY